MAARISKRKQAHPIQAPPSLGYTDIELERAARKPRYIDLSLALRCPDAGLWTLTLPTPCRRAAIAPSFDYLQTIMVNDRSTRRAHRSASPALPKQTRLTALSNKTNKGKSVGRDPSGKVPDTPSTLLPRNTIPSYARKAIAEAADKVASFQPYPAGTAMSRRTSSNGKVSRASSLQRTNSGDALPGFAGGPTRRFNRNFGSVVSRAASPALTVGMLDSSAVAEGSEAPVEDEEEDDAEDDLSEKDYRPPKQQKKKPSPTAGIAEVAIAQPMTRSSSRITRSIRASPAAMSGSEYDSDGSVVSAHSIPAIARAASLAPPAQADQLSLSHQRATLPAPLNLARGALPFAMDGINAPKMHSPLSQTFANA